MEILEVLQEKLGEEVFTEDFKKEMESQFEILINEKAQAKADEKIAEKEQEVEEKKKELDAKKEEIEESLRQEADEYKTELTESIDGYLDYAVKEFFQENKTAIQDEFTVKAAKELIESFANIIESNHFTVDLDQEKRISSLQEKIDQMQKKMNKVIRENIDKKMEIQEYKKSLRFKKLTEGLSKVKVEKVLSLTEGLEFKDMSDFERKVKLCVERVSDRKSAPLQEENEELTESKKTKTSKSDIDKYL